MTETPPHRCALQAEALLARLELAEELAACHDAEPCAQLRQRYAERYRRAVGVAPHRREELRAALQQLGETGRRPVAEILACWPD